MSVRYGGRSRAKKLLDQAQARKGDKRSAAANDQGNQKTPTMIKAVLIDALSGCDDGCTAPRGGFTDVGLHTGGYKRNTSWALIRAVLQTLLEEEQGLFYRHAMAQLALWLCEASVADLLTWCNTDAPYRDTIDTSMQMLSLAVQAGSRLADEQIRMRGGDRLGLRSCRTNLWLYAEATFFCGHDYSAVFCAAVWKKHQAAR